MEFPAVIELLDYWLEYPPDHLLLRMLAGYQGKKQRGGTNWRKIRAEEMGDMDYKPENEKPQSTAEDLRIASQFITGARHLDCAPPHIQLAVERQKLGKHFEVPQ
jgi:hypothetical protein